MTEKRDPMVHVRLPSDLKARVEKSAQEAGRSINAEIVWRLELSYSDTAERLDGLEREVFDSDRGNRALADRILVLEMLQRGEDPYNRDD